MDGWVRNGWGWRLGSCLVRVDVASGAHAGGGVVQGKEGPGSVAVLPAKGRGRQRSNKLITDDDDDDNDVFNLGAPTRACFPRAHT